MSRVVVGHGLGFAAAAMMSLDGFGGFSGPSRAKRLSDELRAKAKAERESWDAPEGESRQVRRARERRAAR